MTADDRGRVQQAAFAALAASSIEPGAKGIRPDRAPLPLGEIARQGWNVLKGDLTFPAAILKRSALTTNSQTMRGFLARHDMAIAPHGKTTMAPQLYRQQLADGAWAMTISTVQHLAVCRRFAIDRVVIANELIGPAELDYLFGELAAAPELELYGLIDSIAGVERLEAAARPHGSLGRFNALIEIGPQGGRAGCRTVEDARTVARAAHAAGLTLRGVEAFEGILSDVAAIDQLLDRLCETAERIADEGLFALDLPVILTAGGSSFYDRVADRLAKGRGIADAVKIVSRSGCYLTHDDGSYATAFAAMQQRDGDTRQMAFEPALFVATHVQSRPERGKAILAMGRRDAGTDGGLPVPLQLFRAGRDTAFQPMPAGHMLTGLNDQHAHMACPPESDIAVGDIVLFGISHPCTTFDKWQVLFMVDDAFDIVDAVKTFF